MPDFQAPQTLLLELSKELQGSDSSKGENDRRKALRIAKDLVASLQTPHELAYETSFLPAYSACCRAAIHLGLFEAISKSEGPITASDLATQTGSQHLLVVRLLRVITGLGLVLEVGLEKYQAIPATHSMASGLIRAAHQLFWDQGLPPLLALPAYLAAHDSQCPTDAKDGLFQQAFSTKLDAFAYWQAQPQPRHALENFNFLMTSVHGKEPAWLSWFPVSERVFEGARQDGGVVFVDVGGCMGNDAVAFKRRMNRDFTRSGRVVLEDLPAVLVEAGQLEEGVEKVDYDIFTPQVVTGARVYYYAHVFHDWSDEASVQILRNAKPAMERGYSKIFLYEFILPDTGCSLLQAGYDIHMMGMHAGMERTRSQWTSLLENEGFKVKFWIAPDAENEGIIEIELA
ncbi:hypothetical protein DSL72_003098 [Monilinia vaccinii-corymbosi]|uniref:O-methyltransferase domain-containing protein n=1 Tax=Monilinia vaccinii-corymbosi TaxID=61207 RepID=A0A8A3P7I1_9HELO|nr:hypothetical protein DSL72_003098 [Monilinia vaccinii-corymbosi]